MPAPSPSGIVRRGDRVSVAHPGAPATVTRIVTMDGELRARRRRQAVTLVLADEIDISRGDVLAAAWRAADRIGDQFDAHWSG